MFFKCCLVIRTIAGTLDNSFSKFRHFAIYPNFSIFFFFFFFLLLLLLFLFGRATVKLKCNISVKTIGGYLKYQYPMQWAFKSAVFLYDYRIWTKAASFWTPSSRSHKSRANAHHQNCLSSNGITPKTT